MTSTKEPAGSERTRSVAWLRGSEPQTWIALWTISAWMPTRLDQQLQRDHGLSLHEYNALSQISMAPEQTIRMSELGRITNMTLSHLSRVIARLEKAGMVTRSTDPHDRRVTLAHLTRQGLRLVETAAPGHVEAVRELIFDGLTPEQSRALGEAAGIIAERLHPDARPRV